MCCGGGGGGADPNVGAAALAQANLSKEQLDWAKGIYAEQAPDRADAIRRANLTSDAQLVAMQKQTALTDDYAAYQKNTFRPLEQGIVDGAANYDTPERREAAAAKAGADVQTSFDNAQSQQQRGLSRMGVNPSAGKELAMSNQLGIQKAMGLASAENKARTDTELQGYARKMDAANMGRGLASAQATSAGVALSQGNSAVNNGLQSGAINAQGNSIMQTGFSGAGSAMASAGGLYAQNAQMANQAAQKDSGLMGAIGGVAGAYAGSSSGSAAITGLFASDKNIKKDIKPVSGKASLAALRKIPVSSWKYKPGSVGDDGEISHTGPMAQDVRKGLGNTTAPGGKKIDVISMSGHQTGAIKELDRRIANLENSRRPKRK